MLVMLSLVLFSAGAALSTLWIYTGGRLDQNSIERALPVITRDAEALASKASLYIGKKVIDISKIMNLFGTDEASIQA